MHSATAECVFVQPAELAGLSQARAVSPRFRPESFHGRGGRAQVHGGAGAHTGRTGIAIDKAPGRVRVVRLG